MKTFTYRGVLREFSNRYHFDGANVADSAHWDTLMDAIVLAEKTIYPTVAQGGARIVRAVGYNAGSEVPVKTKTYTTEGTLSPTGFNAMPGDVAALIRYSTAAVSSKNHPVYLFNYYHGVSGTAIPSTSDQLMAAQLTAMQTYGTAWITGFSDGAVTRHRCAPQGSLALTRLVEPLLTHRDLPR